MKANRLFIKTKNKKIEYMQDKVCLLYTSKIHIPLKKMQSKALGQIAEICFVIHPADVLEKEGMFQISEITIS